LPLPISVDQRRQSFVERFSGLRRGRRGLAGAWAGDAGFDGGEIEGEKFGIFGFGSFVVVEEALLAAVGFDQSNLIRGTSAEF